MPQKPVSAHLKSRRETGDILRSGTVAVTEIRAGMIIGPGSAAWEVIRDLVNNLPVMITPRWVRSRSTPIALENLLRYLAEAGRFEETAGEIFEVGGSENLTYIDIMRQYGELVGKRPLIIQVPVLTPRLSSYWLRLVTSVPTNIARALIDGVSQDVIVSDRRLDGLMPQPLADFTTAAKAALEADFRHAIPARWVEGAMACRNFRPEYSYYPKRAGAAATTRASSDALWDVLTTVGDRGDFFHARVLWWLRRAVDWLVGGPSFRRRRRHPRQLRVGDAVDAWRVIAIEPGRRLTLLMEMRAPGAGVIEYSLDDSGTERRIGITAYWHPAGAWGLLYWFALWPFHDYLFKHTAGSIARRAERLERRLIATR